MYAATCMCMGTHTCMAAPYAYGTAVVCMSLVYWPDGIVTGRYTDRQTHTYKHAHKYTQTHTCAREYTHAHAHT